VKVIDNLAKDNYASRSDFIRETLVRRIKGQRLVDEWGDLVGEWEAGIDLRDRHGQGVKAETVLAVIDELLEEKPNERQTKKIPHSA